MPAASWQETILREFTPGVSPLTVMADPDGLLQDDGILAELRQRGFSLLRFEDPLAFRYAYESRFRLREAQADAESLVVVVPASAAPEHLPYDILAGGRRLAFGLADLFPSLNQAVVSALEPVDRAALYEAVSLQQPAALGKNASKDFVLRHVFGTVPELVRTPAALLSVLLRRHYAGRRVPPMFDARFIQAIKGRFQDWPLGSIVPDREAFFDFLQRGWRMFLDAGVDGPGAVGEGTDALTSLLPFDHEDVRVYIDNLFAEGLLQPVSHRQASTLSKTWLGVGVQWDARQAATARLDRLLAIAAKSLPEEEARHQDWFRFAKVWARIAALTHEPNGKPSEQQREEIDGLRARMDAAFSRWAATRYASLASLPPNPPAMLHHVPRFLAQEIGGTMERAALVVADGLALDQWAVMRQELARQRPGWRFRESATFAWVPTVTSVSRQAIFAGTPPFFFPNSIHTTNKEEALWRKFWADEGIGGAVYARSLDDGPFEDVAALVDRPNVRVAGLVVDKVDHIMHGMTLGAAGMHNQVRQWAAQGHFAALLDVLFERGFRVYVTSDHGNVEAVGCGRPNEGAVADMRGERVRVYSEEGLRRGVAERFAQAWQWPADGLPADYLPLLAPGRKAFVREGERVVVHGGVCLEELIVPFVQVEPG